jgi:hypothetical protein
MPTANEDVGFRGRGPRNQYIPPILEENLRDNAYATMKKGGKVVGSSASLPRIKKVKKTKKGKTTASATAIVNVYTGRRRTAPAQPRPPKPPQPINVSVQMPNYLQSNMSEPFQNMRLQDLQRINDIQAQMLKMTEPLKALQLNGMLTRPNVGEPIRQQDAYEPYDPIEMKHEKEPDELIVMEQDLQPYTPYQVDTPPYVMTPPESQEDVAAEAVGDEAPIRRKRRTKEEMEIARLAKEETKRIKEEAKKRLAELKEEQDAERLFNQIRQVRMEIVKRQREDPNHPQLPQLRKQLDTLTKK